MEPFPCIESHLDPILWRSRDSNKIADHLVNVTMDMGRSWQHVEPWDPDFKLEDANVEIHCDGGRRGSACSASAWVMEAHWYRHGERITRVVAMAGTYNEIAVSSFAAELMAVDSCAGFLVQACGSTKHMRSACQTGLQAVRKEGRKADEEA